MNILTNFFEFLYSKQNKFFNSLQTDESWDKSWIKKKIKKIFLINYNWDKMKHQLNSHKKMSWITMCTYSEKDIENINSYNMKGLILAPFIVFFPFIIDFLLGNFSYPIHKLLILTTGFFVFLVYNYYWANFSLIKSKSTELEITIDFNKQEISITNPKSLKSMIGNVFGFNTFSFYSNVSIPIFWLPENTSKEQIEQRAELQQLLSEKVGIQFVEDFTK